MQSELIYFSATGTTATIVTEIGRGTGIAAQHTIDLLRAPAAEIRISRDTLAVIGVPVFSGRVPETARERLAMLRGDQTPAILVCVYGNRDFDDALVELRDIARANGFVPVAAAAFVAQHSIFPAVGAGRPDAQDLTSAREFGRRGAELASSETGGELAIRGNVPYRDYKRVPLAPKTSRQCNGCGACAKACPVQAIDPHDPRRTDKRLCTACAHCIAVCPQQARHFGGLLYWLAGRKFTKAYTRRCEPYRVYASAE